MVVVVVTKEACDASSCRALRQDNPADIRRRKIPVFFLRSLPQHTSFEQKRYIKITYIFSKP